MWTIITRLIICSLTVCCVAFLAFDARRSYQKAITFMRTIMAATTQDLANHLAPLVAAAKDDVSDLTSLLQQVKSANMASGADNTLVDQALATIDGVTTSLTNAHQAVLAAGATVSLSPTSASLAQGGTQAFTATASDGSTPSLSVSPSTLGTIDAAGNFTAGTTPGSGAVVASLANGASASASVTVS